MTIRNNCGDDKLNREKNLDRLALRSSSKLISTWNCRRKYDGIRPLDNAVSACETGIVPTFDDRSRGVFVGADMQSKKIRQIKFPSQSPEAERKNSVKNLLAGRTAHRPVQILLM
jgi:hypothetical protein